MSARARFQEQHSLIRTNAKKTLCPGKVHRRCDTRAVVCEALGLQYRPIAAPRDLNQLRAATAKSPDAIDRGIRHYVPMSFEVMEVGDLVGRAEARI